MTTKKIALSAAISLLAGGYTNIAVSAETITEALTGGKAYGHFNLRMEAVEQDNAREDATALTLRTRLGYNTDTISGFSGTVEFEDSRIVPLPGADEFSTPNGFNGTEYSVIADPETTELDQFLVQYKNDVVTAKLGRQVFTLDDHRFIGHVGWRQDRQTFDALSVVVSPVKEFKITFAYLDQRNRIIAEDADKDSEDIILNAAYTTPIGPVKAYAYLLDEEDVDNAKNDTIGFSFAPKFDNLSFHAEFATQETDNNEADYLRLEGALKAGAVNLKAGYELLGSDEGEYGFSTPLATLHKFNGWADQFLGTPDGGLEDIYFSVSGKVLGGKAAAIYHDFSSDEGDAVDASEIDLLYTKKFGKNYNFGVKAAFFTTDSDQIATIVDTDKLWLWVGAGF